MDKGRRNGREEGNDMRLKRGEKPGGTCRR